MRVWAEFMILDVLTIMKFIDEITISVRAGDGGSGCMSFLREKFRPNGGPDGGNGGRGGDIVLKAVTNLQSLADLEHRKRFVAKNGNHGEGNSRNGRAGESVIIPVPCGTLVFDAESKEGIADLVEAGDVCVAAMGGRGGRGNKVFASSLRRAPRFSEKGERGEERPLRLELRLIADIGLIGLPNAGKSSILAAVSNAAPKIADYPFTTLSPNLGVISTDIDSVVMADIPGLIEGASQDKGLGISFLRHIERTRMLLHVLDLSSGSAEIVEDDWRVVRSEMERYDPELGSRPCIIVGNKSDLCEDLPEKSGALAGFFSGLGMEFMVTSALTEENIPELTKRVIDFSREHPRPKGEVRIFSDVRVLGMQDLPQSGTKRKIQIVPTPGGAFRVICPQLEQAAERYDFSQSENTARFTRLLRKYRVEELLEAAGAAAGSSVSIGHSSFDFYPDNDDFGG
ncbi:MAG: GTPase ObgE [Synergistaceae bacterium]|jgi:GTP-binding protein|nr:GTPase ObgE [Synergistaceae bacterium]